MFLAWYKDSKLIEQTFILKIKFSGKIEKSAGKRRE